MNTDPTLNYSCCNQTVIELFNSEKLHISTFFDNTFELALIIIFCITDFTVDFSRDGIESKLGFMVSYLIIFQFYLCNSDSASLIYILTLKNMLR